MVLKQLTETIYLLKHPILWMPGIYTGLLLSAAIWLEFSGSEFIAGKGLFLGAVLTPLFLGGALGCMNSGDFSPAAFFRFGLRFFFPVLLPVIIAVTISILLLILLSIPFAIAGLGNEPTMIGGLFIGIIVPIAIFSFFADNVAVAEGLKVFESLKKSMIIASQSFLTIISCVIINIITAGGLMLVIAMIWGMILSEKFTQYLNLGMAEQQKIFSTFGLTEWQNILGTDGILVTAAMIGLFVMILVTFFILFKHQCYLSASTATHEVIQQQVGEYDEKGRWYKY